MNQLDPNNDPEVMYRTDEEARAASLAMDAELKAIYRKYGVHATATTSVLKYGGEGDDGGSIVGEHVLGCAHCMVAGMVGFLRNPAVIPVVMEQAEMEQRAMQEAMRSQRMPSTAFRRGPGRNCRDH